jgi:hypothetical protein
MTQREVYNLIYAHIRCQNTNLSEDKASRLANIIAVKTTWRSYNNPRKLEELQQFSATVQKDQHGLYN